MHVGSEGFTDPAVTEFSPHLVPGKPDRQEASGHGELAEADRREAGGVNASRYNRGSSNVTTAGTSPDAGAPHWPVTFVTPCLSWTCPATSSSSPLTSRRRGPTTMSTPPAVRCAPAATCTHRSPNAGRITLLLGGYLGRGHFAGHGRGRQLRAGTWAVGRAAVRLACGRRGPACSGVGDAGNRHRPRPVFLARPGRRRVELRVMDCRDPHPDGVNLTARRHQSFPSASFPARARAIAKSTSS